jgi:hypothetical protein
MQLLIFFSFFSIFFALLSSFFEMDAIRLWKELLVITIILFTFLSYYKMNLLKGFFIYLIILFFIINLFISDNIFNVVYQFKLDLLLFIFAISSYYFFQKIERKVLESFLYSMVKIIILLGFLHALSSIFEGIFFDNFIAMLGIEDGDWGTHGGLKIITTFGHLRAPGLTTGFVQAGTLILLSWVLFLYYNDILFNLTRFSKLIIGMVFFYGLVSTTYKTALLGFFLISLFYFIDRVNIRNKLFFYALFSIAIFILFFSSSISYWLYELLRPYNESLVYNSIYLRVKFHYDVFVQVENIIDLLFGVGYGVNGTFGTKDGVDSVPLDSTFIYIFSNYGMVGVLTFLLSSLGLIFKLKGNNSLERPLFFYLFYIVTLEFFFNNVITNFPLNYLLVLLLTTTILLQRKNHVNS